MSALSPALDVGQGIGIRGLFDFRQAMTIVCLLRRLASVDSAGLPFKYANDLDESSVQDTGHPGQLPARFDKLSGMFGQLSEPSLCLSEWFGHLSGNFRHLAENFGQLPDWFRQLSGPFRQPTPKQHVNP